jgi:hypothetical protein
MSANQRNKATREARENFYNKMGLILVVGKVIHAHVKGGVPEDDAHPMYRVLSLGVEESAGM